MNRMPPAPSRTPVLLGGLLVVAGAAAFALQESGVRIPDLGEHGWPFFVIAPGLMLLVAAVLVARPHGTGFAIAGSIVTTIGLILLYQSSTGDWESWAYAWALIPGAAGVAMVIYGAISAERPLIDAGSRLAVIATVLFVVGLWFFGPILTGGRLPADLDQWLPAAVIALGLAIVISAALGSRSDDSRHGDQGHPA
jgi:hypothetical protein